MVCHYRISNPPIQSARPSSEGAHHEEERPARVAFVFSGLGWRLFDYASRWAALRWQFLSNRSRRSASEHSQYCECADGGAGYYSGEEYRRPFAAPQPSQPAASHPRQLNRKTKFAFTTMGIVTRMRRRLLPRRDAACAPQSLYLQAHPARSHSAKIPWSSCPVPASWTSTRLHS